MNRIKANFEAHCQIFEEMRSDNALLSAIDEAARACVLAFTTGKKILLAGNGGSAADAQHIAAEFVGRFLLERRPLPSLALTTDTSALTCISNDYDFSEVFARQIDALGESGDIFIAISTSGNSKNVVNAAKRAKQKNLVVVALTGEGRSMLSQISDISLRVPTQTTARIQEAHIFLGHLLCEVVEVELQEKGFLNAQ